MNCLCALLNHNGVAVYIVNEYGDTARHLARAQKEANFVRLLKEHLKTQNSLDNENFPSSDNSKIEHSRRTILHWMPLILRHDSCCILRVASPTTNLERNHSATRSRRKIVVCHGNSPSK